MKTKLFAALGAFLLLANCATGPTMTESGAAQSSVQAGKSRIVVYRSGVFGAAVQPVIRVDGRETGKCTPNGAFQVETSPGDHRISATTEVQRSTVVTARSGQTSYVKCSIGIGILSGRPQLEVVPAATGAAESSGLAYTGKY